MMKAQYYTNNAYDTVVILETRESFTVDAEIMEDFLSLEPMFVDWSGFVLGEDEDPTDYGELIAERDDEKQYADVLDADAFQARHDFYVRFPKD